MFVLVQEKPVSAEEIENVALQVEEDKVSNVQACFRVRFVVAAIGSASFNCPEDHDEYPPVLSVQASICAGIAST